MTAHSGARSAILLIVVAACTPTLDWREVHVDGAALTALFPCRPDRHVRTVPIGGDAVRMELLSCRAGDATWALSYFDVADPRMVDSTLGVLRRVTVENVDGSAVGRAKPFDVRGMPPDPRAVRVAIEGRLPDGTTVHEEVAWFVDGRRVYQASVLGASPPKAGIDDFVSGLEFSR